MNRLDQIQTEITEIKSKQQWCGDMEHENLNLRLNTLEAELIRENDHLRRTLNEYENNPQNQIIRWATCPGCGSRWVRTFMVHDELWQESKLTGCPCILCFEKAIGRRLYIEDLKKSPLCNHMLELGWFLGDRKFGEFPSQ